MKNVDVRPDEGKSTRLTVYAHTADRACMIVELITIMGHTVKNLSRDGGNDHYAHIEIYTGSDNVERVARYIENIDSV